MSKQSVVVVAGGTSGIGEQVVDLYLQEGAIVYAIGKSTEHCDLMSKNHQNPSLRVLQQDLADYTGAISVIDKIKMEEKCIDFLINSVGTISGGGILQESFSDWNRVIENNLNTLFNMTKSSISLLEKGEGKAILNVSSVCSLRPCTSLSYSVSKAGTDMFTKVLAKELASKNIRVNAVNPGVVISNLQKSAGLFADEPSYQEWVENMKGFHLLNCVGEPIDIAEAILFLNSKQAKWITGSILSVDGGRAIA